MTAEAIELRDVDNGALYTDEIVVRGHVDDATATEAAQCLWYDLGLEGDVIPAYGPWRHRWARWLWTGVAERAQELRLYSERSRGAFPVTVATAQHLIDSRAAYKQRCDDARARVAELWPDCEIESISGGTADAGAYVWLLVPGLEWSVRWDVLSGDLWVSRGDQERWGAWWQSRDVALCRRFTDTLGGVAP